MACAVIGATLGCSQTVERDRVGGGWITPFGDAELFQGHRRASDSHAHWDEVKSNSARLVWVG